jgi:hypothetical protein
VQVLSADGRELLLSNAEARRRPIPGTEALAARGQDQIVAFEVGGVPMRAGDKVMMLRNDRSVGVRNGNRGVVLDVNPDEHSMHVLLGRGVVDVPARYVDAGHVGLAYAMTVNKAHGTTCDATMTLADDLLYRELAYEAMSRGRVENRIYISRTTMVELELRLEDGPHAPLAPEDDPLDILAAGVEQRRNKLLALDQIALSRLTHGAPPT